MTGQKDLRRLFPRYSRKVATNEDETPGHGTVGRHGTSGTGVGRTMREQHRDNGSA